MARYHTVTVETIGYFTFIIGNEEEPIQKWKEANSEEYLIDEIDVKVYAYGDPEILEDKPLEQGREIKIKSEASINKNIVTSDEEYKVWKLIDWDYPSRCDFDKVSISLDYDEKFEVVCDDSWWVEDDELSDFDQDQEY